MPRLLEGYIGRGKNKKSSEKPQPKPFTPEDWFAQAEEAGEAEKSTTNLETTAEELHRIADEKERPVKIEEMPEPNLHLVPAANEISAVPRIDREKLLSRKTVLQEEQTDLHQQLQRVREELAKINLELAGESEDDLSQAA
jgi:hypothetical protein